MLVLLRLPFAPVVQGAIGDPQIASNLRDTLAAALHQPHRFQLELFRKGSLFLWHLAPPFLWRSIFQLPLLHKTGASSNKSDSAHGNDLRKQGKIKFSATCHIVEVEV